MAAATKEGLAQAIYYTLMEEYHARGGVDDVMSVEDHEDGTLTIKVELWGGDLVVPEKVFSVSVVERPF